MAAPGESIWGAVIGLGAFLLAASIAASPVMAQTREETESWIIKQTEQNLMSARSIGISLTYAIEGDQLIRRIAFPAASGGGTAQTSISIKQINRIGYVFTERYLSYSLLCETECIDQFSQGMESAEPADKRKFLFEIFRKLDPGFPPRMHKALLKLVELHGGKAKLFQLPPQREPF
jgi:hypothetical protein